MGTTGVTAQISGISIYNNTINSISTSTDISIGAGQTSGVLYLGTNSSRTSDITIGSVGCTINMGGIITVQQGITLNNNKFISFGTGVPSISNQLGYIVQTTVAAGPISVSNSVDTLIYTWNAPVGVWIVRFQGSMSAACPLLTVSLGTTNNNVNANDITSSTIGLFNLITMRAFSTGTTQYLVGRCLTTSISVSNIQLYLTRIG
jgi:hypothetical protein